MVFLFLKPLLKGNLVKEQYSFPNVFVTTCFVARKMNFCSVMFLAQLFESMSPWVHVQVKWSTQSVSQQLRDLWHLLDNLQTLQCSQSLFGCWYCPIVLKGKLMKCDMLSAVIMKLQDLSVFVEGLLGSQLSSPYCPMGTALSLQEGVRILFACINSS